MATRRCPRIPPRTAAFASRCGSRRVSSPAIPTARRSTSTNARLLAAATAAAGFTIALVVYGLWPEERGRPVVWTDLAPQVGSLEITRERRQLFRKRSELDRALRALGADRRPVVDFQRRQVLLVSPGPRSSTGYALLVEDVRDKGDQIVVAVRELTPKLGDRVAPRVTFPYRLLSLPAGKDVYVDWKGR